MAISHLFSEAFSALRANLLRTLLTMLGIVIGIASVILIISLGQGATASITDEISSFGTNIIAISPGRQQMGPARGSGVTNTLKYSDAEAIREAKLPGVKDISAQAGKQSQVIADGENIYSTVQGVEPAYQTIQSLDVVQGLFIDDDHLSSQGRVAVLGADAAKDLFGAGAEPVGSIIRIDGSPFRVIGVLGAKGSSGFSSPDDSVFVPVTTALKRMLGQDHVDTIMVSTNAADDVPAVSSQLEEFLFQRHEIEDPDEKDFSLMNPQDAISIIGNVTGILTALLAAVAAISLVVGGIGIMNIMLVTVTERTREIGLSKAIGATRRHILAQFLVESVALTAFGGVVGIALGVFLNYLLASALNIPFIVSAGAVLISFGVSSLVGIVFGLYPARRAAHLSPIDALRYE